jgi:hypothetical protein
MIERFFNLKESILKINNPGLHDAMPIPSEERKLHALLKQMENLNSVTLELQRSSLTINEGRMLFDSVIRAYPVTSYYLGIRASIVHSPDFECGIIKIMSGEETSMTEDERTTCRILEEPLEIISDEEKTEEKKTLTFAQQALLGKRKADSMSQPTTYQYPKFINPTSNIVERLFSLASLVLTDLRGQLSPYHFEAVVFLKINRNYWSALVVHEVMKKG